MLSSRDQRGLVTFVIIQASVVDCIYLKTPHHVNNSYLNSVSLCAVLFFSFGRLILIGTKVKRRSI